MVKSISWEILNAYADGELDAATAAEVERAAANNPAIAQNIAALARAKSLLADSIDMMEIELPAPPVTTERPTRHRMAAAAVLVLALTTAFVMRMALPGMHDPLSVHWVKTAHSNWTANTGGNEPATASILHVTANIGFDKIYIPDLASSRLWVAHVGHRKDPGHCAALIVGYRGTRGCTVTLAVSRRVAGLSAEALAVSIGDMTGYAWRTGKYGYYVLADGMAASRLEGIASGIREASLRHLPLSADTRIALARSRAKSPPCRL